MKSYKLSLIFFLTFFSVKAQTDTLEKSLKNYEGLKILSSLKSSFSNKDVKHIDIGYFHKKPTYIKVYLNDTVQINGFRNNSQYFDLNFEGDAFMLKQSYPWIDVPSPMHIKAQDIDGKAKNDRYYIRVVSIYPDSTTFYYSKNIELDKDFPNWGFPAKYTGNLNTIQDEISGRLKQNKSGQLQDSVCVFELSVTKQGELASGKLIGGDKSIFTQSAYETIFLKKNKYFEDGRSMWRPAIIYSSGRPIATKLKLFARLNKDGSVLISLPSTLRNFTGN